VQSREICSKPRKISVTFNDAAGGDESFPQPLTFAGGASLARRAAKVDWLGSFEVLKLRGDDPEARVGVEARPVPGFALRGGWMFGQDSNDLTAGAGLAAGRWAFDYAFVPYRNGLGNSHRAGLTARF
jgi:hypothetical protein